MEIIRCDAEGSRNRRLMIPISLGFFGRSMSLDISKRNSSHGYCQYSPSISAGLSKSIRKMRPVESASMRTLLATSAATKSEEIENWSDTRSTLNIGSDISVSWGFPLVGGA